MAPLRLRDAGTQIVAWSSYARPQLGHLPETPSYVPDLIRRRFISCFPRYRDSHSASVTSSAHSRFAMKCATSTSSPIAASRFTQPRGVAHGFQPTSCMNSDSSTTAAE